MARSGSAKSTKARAASSVEDLRLLITMFEARQPGTPMIRMCARALDLYDAALATGDVGLVEQVGDFIDQLTEGILMGLSVEEAENQKSPQLHS